jgi:tetratricopeptide (TPR) repeat protein
MLSIAEREGRATRSFMAALNASGEPSRLPRTALYQETGRYAEAEPLYERAIAIDETALGPEHPQLATDLNNLAGLYQETGRYAEAEPLFGRAIAIDEKVLGPEHPDVAGGLNNLAEVYRKTGRYADAEALYVRALAICEARARARSSEHQGDPRQFRTAEAGAGETGNA